MTNQESHNNLITNLNKGQRIAVISVAIIFLTLIAISVVQLLGRAGKVPIITQFAPYNATVTLNDYTIKNHNTNYIKPGTYQLTVSFEHFKTFHREVIIEHDSKYLVGILESSDDEGKNYAHDHSIEFVETQSLVGAQLNLEGISRKKKYPITTKLPFNSALYSLSYHYKDNNPNGEPILTVKSSPEQLSAAVSKLFDYAKDDDITRYDIEFIGHQNPFLISNPQSLPRETDPQAFLNLVYPRSVNQDFRLAEGTHLDNYYLTTAHIYNFDLDLHLADYRIVLKQDQDQTWSFATTPQVILTTANSPELPQEILKAANQL